MGSLVAGHEGLMLMDVAAFLKSLEASGLATKIRDSIYLFPMLESIHVLGLALVFGTISIIDDSAVIPRYSREAAAGPRESPAHPRASPCRPTTAVLIR